MGSASLNFSFLLTQMLNIEPDLTIQLNALFKSENNYIRN